VVNCITVPNPCRENWVNELIHCLKGGHIWIVPRRLRISDLFDNKADKFVSEVLANMGGEVLDPRINF